jgi:hypothetical protein
MKSIQNNRQYEESPGELSFSGSNDEYSVLDPFPGGNFQYQDEDDNEIIDGSFSEYPDDMDYDE